MDKRNVLRVNRASQTCNHGRNDECHALDADDIDAHELGNVIIVANGADGQAVGRGNKIFDRQRDQHDEHKRDEIDLPLAREL